MGIAYGVWSLSPQIEVLSGGNRVLRLGGLMGCGGLRGCGGWDTLLLCFALMACLIVRSVGGEEE